jgi:indole-3-glycerol phosphate synthase
MDILEKIIQKKQQEVAEAKALYPTQLLEKSLYFETPCVSLKKYVRRADKSGIIAEIKRRSPSKPSINPYVDVERTSIGYMQAGASALSVLTDREFFGGTNEDLKVARKFNFCPILRKDFTIDEYQIVEAKSIGADAILLIAAALAPQRMKTLAAFAKSLGLEVLVEVHAREELDAALAAAPDLLGVNNRNLKTFATSLETSIELAAQIPDSVVKVSESGISKPAAILQLKHYGFEGFLIGEHFMQNSRPELACARFIEDVRRLEADEQNSPLLA